MEATPQIDPPAPVGELILQNGRLNGARKPLGLALTLLGSADGCDIRLNVDAVLPVHCALVRGTDGLVVRALPGAATLLNDQPVTECLVRDGDLLGVGPFQFRVALPAEPADRGREKDALRIQAAAVAAQQAALTEEEVRLQQRRVALERQEAQLSAHLEERRKNLVELQEQVREARMALRDERTEHEKRVAETTAELLLARREVTTGQEQLRGERNQLTELHRRLKERHAARWKATEDDLRRREERLGEERRKVEADRGALNDARLRFNGEAELGRRQLQDGWDEFRRARKQWDERRGREDAELRRRARELAQVEQALADQWQQWHDARQALEAEAEGLEGRVRNLRRKAQEQEAHLRDPVPTAAPAPAEVSPPPPAELGAAEREHLAGLEALAEKLDDQRLHLLEQAERLVRAEEEWRGWQRAALAEVEEAARRLDGREEQMEPRDRALGEAEAELRHRAEAAARLQAHLDGWQARLTARAAAWDADREALLASVREREEAARRHAELLTDLRRRLAQRRKKEVAAVRGELKRCQAARRQYAALWEDCHNHGAALERQQRALAEKSLALEQYRLEVIGRAPDSAAAEKRLERLRRRCAAPTAAARRNLDRERQALDAERKRVEGQAEQLDQQAAALAEREAELARRLAEWEAGQAGAETDRARLRAEVASLTAQRAYREREAQALRDEVERLARLLMDDGPALLSIGNAA
jgi:chromosome segregation ATPase